MEIIRSFLGSKHKKKNTIFDVSYNNDNNDNVSKISSLNQNLQSNNLNNSSHVTNHLSRRLYYQPWDSTKSLQGPKLFGQSLEWICSREKSKVPFLLVNCAQIVCKHGLETEGIFRLCGNTRKVDEMKEHINESWKGESSQNLLQNHFKPLHEIVSRNLESNLYGDEVCDVITVVAVLKSFLRQLPSPLVGPPLVRDFLYSVTVKKVCPDKVSNRLRELTEKLPATHLSTLKHLVQLMVVVCRHGKVNKMSPQALGIVMGPNIFRVGLVQQEMANSVVAMMIEGYDEIFKEQCDSFRFSSGDMQDPNNAVVEVKDKCGKVFRGRQPLFGLHGGSRGEDKDGKENNFHADAVKNNANNNRKTHVSTILNKEISDVISSFLFRKEKNERNEIESAISETHLQAPKCLNETKDLAPHYRYYNSSVQDSLVTSNVKVGRDDVDSRSEEKVEAAYRMDEMLSETPQSVSNGITHQSVSSRWERVCGSSVEESKQESFHGKNCENVRVQKERRPMHESSSGSVNAHCLMFERLRAPSHGNLSSSSLPCYLPQPIHHLPCHFPQPTKQTDTLNIDGKTTQELLECPSPAAARETYQKEVTVKSSASRHGEMMDLVGEGGLFRIRSDNSLGNKSPHGQKKDSQQLRGWSKGEKVDSESITTPSNHITEATMTTANHITEATKTTANHINQSTKTTANNINQSTKTTANSNIQSLARTSSEVTTKRFETGASDWNHEIFPSTTETTTHPPSIPSSPGIEQVRAVSTFVKYPQNIKSSSDLQRADVKTYKFKTIPINRYTGDVPGSFTVSTNINKERVKRRRRKSKVVLSGMDGVLPRCVECVGDEKGGVVIGGVGDEEGGVVIGGVGDEEGGVVNGGVGIEGGRGGRNLEGTGRGGVVEGGKIDGRSNGKTEGDGYIENREELAGYKVKQRTDLEVKTSFVELLKVKLIEKRQSEERPSNTRRMNLKQLKDEKTDLQKMLLYYEEIFGKAKIQEEKDLVRSFYNRYSNIKQMIKNLDSTATPILSAHSSSNNPTNHSILTRMNTH